MCELPFLEPTVSWFDSHARDLPWRAPDRTAWGVLVSEVMLQQTPVARVEPVWSRWMARWPTAGDLAAAGRDEVLRDWGRLGYPRRALRLHECAAAVRDRHGGLVPRDTAQLEALPGVGRYTAAAVRAFAFGLHSVVVDTNVRRVVARLRDGVAQARGTAREWAAAAELVPPDDAAAARWNAAVMELGALVCTARSPGCERCPLAFGCRWLAAGRPEAERPAGRAQAWEGTDRQVRGRVMALLRDLPAAERGTVDRVWPDQVQLQRCLDSLAADGLVQVCPSPTGPVYRLPT